MTHHHDHAHAPTGEDGSAAMAQLLDLDELVLHAFLFDITAWVREQITDVAIQRIADLGAGTGSGALALAQRFDTAEVIAVDQSGELIERIRAKADGLGLAERVRTVEADLDGAWPAFEPLDLVWASLSIHHLADPDRALKDILDSLRPGGRLVIVEMETPPRFLPDDVGAGRPGLEERCHQAVRAELAATMPLLGADWGPHLEQGGFTVDVERTFSIEPTRPDPSAVGRYAQTYLRRIRSALGRGPASEDLAILDRLIADDGPDSVLRRGDLRVRGTRTAWLARRP